MVEIPRSAPGLFSRLAVARRLRPLRLHREHVHAVLGVAAAVPVTAVFAKGYPRVEARVRRLAAWKDPASARTVDGGRVLATAEQRERVPLGERRVGPGHWAVFEARVALTAVGAAVAEAVGTLVALPLVVSKRILFDVVAPWGPHACLRAAYQGEYAPALGQDILNCAADWLRLDGHDPDQGHIPALTGELVCCTGQNSFGGWRADDIVRRAMELFDRRGYLWRSEAHAVNLIALRSPCPIPGRFDDALLALWREPAGPGSWRHCGPVHAPRDLEDEDGWHVGLFSCTTDPVLFHSALSSRVLGVSVLAEGIYPYELRLPEDASHEHDDAYEQLQQTGRGVDLWDEWEGLERGVKRSRCQVHRAAAGGSVRPGERGFRRGDMPRGDLPRRWRAGSIVLQHPDDYGFLLALLRSAELDHGKRFAVAVAQQGDLFPFATCRWNGEACFHHVLRQVLAVPSPAVPHPAAPHPQPQPACARAEALRVLAHACNAVRGKVPLHPPPPIPADLDSFCTVETGEYAVLIARRHGISLQDLQALNPGHGNLTRLVPGQRLRVRHDK